MDRTWTKMRALKLIGFYLGFYSCLGLFLVVCMGVLNEMIDYYEPYYTQSDSLIGQNPGLGFRPYPRNEPYSSLVWFRKGSDGNWPPMVDDLQEFLKPYYSNDKPGEHVTGCNWKMRLPEKRVCTYPTELISNNCSKSREFGYDVGLPCILVKINRIYGWEPEPYRHREDMPLDMPRDIRDNYDPRNVYISCNGETDADKENIGPVAYYPENFIPSYFYPYTNLEGYLSPFIFVHFLNPASGVVISIECKAWAKNIKHNSADRTGIVHFELMVD